MPGIYPLKPSGKSRAPAKGLTIRRIMAARTNASALAQALVNLRVRRWLPIRTPSIPVRRAPYRFGHRPVLGIPLRDPARHLPRVLHVVHQLAQHGPPSVPTRAFHRVAPQILYSTKHLVPRNGAPTAGTLMREGLRAFRRPRYLRTSPTVSRKRQAPPISTSSSADYRFGGTFGQPLEVPETPQKASKAAAPGYASPVGAPGKGALALSGLLSASRGRIFGRANGRGCGGSNLRCSRSVAVRGPARLPRWGPFGRLLRNSGLG